MVGARNYEHMSRGRWVRLATINQAICVVKTDVNIVVGRNLTSHPKLLFSMGAMVINISSTILEIFDIPNGGSDSCESPAVLETSRLSGITQINGSMLGHFGLS